MNPYRKKYLTRARRKYITYYQCIFPGYNGNRCYRQECIRKDQYIFSEAKDDSKAKGQTTWTWILILSKKAKNNGWKQ
jgi:hypothetical protein